MVIKRSNKNYLIFQLNFSHATSQFFRRVYGVAPPHPPSLAELKGTSARHCVSRVPRVAYMCPNLRRI